jgi:hypothetical protein
MCVFKKQTLKFCDGVRVQSSAVKIFSELTSDKRGEKMEEGVEIASAR